METGRQGWQGRRVVACHVDAMGKKMKSLEGNAREVFDVIQSAREVRDFLNGFHRFPSFASTTHHKKTTPT